LGVMGCSKSEEYSDNDGTKINQKSTADYTLLLKSNGELKGTHLNGDAETLTLNEGGSSFTSRFEPLLISEDGSILTMYHKNSSCTGTVTIHNFKDDSSESYEVFEDLGTCSLIPKAIVKGGDNIYVAYEKEVDAKLTDFAVRAIDITDNQNTYVDISLKYNPVGLTFSDNRLFILSLDEDVSGEHKLIVIDASTKTEVFNGNLGFDARNIFKNPDGDIIVGYDELHTTIDRKTMTFLYTNYGPGSAPNFTKSALRHFDSNGLMYYAMVAGTFSSYTTIPAVYDFNKNSAVLYAFENFLTEAQLKFEFEIENTTMVHYDEDNNLLLVGYKKSVNGDKGGLLRINPVPQPKFEGNLDLDGIPYAIYFN
ncbi:hypothetical protein LCGC14_1941790, partial [marine sediment metagenome]